MVDLIRLAVMGAVMETKTDENGAPLNFRGWWWGLGLLGLAGVRGDHSGRSGLSAPTHLSGSGGDGQPTILVPGMEITR